MLPSTPKSDPWEGEEGEEWPPWAPQVAQTIADLQGFKFLRGALANPAVAPFKWRGPREFITLFQDKNKCRSLTRILTAAVVTFVMSFVDGNPRQSCMKAWRRCWEFTTFSGNQSFNQSFAPSVPLHLSCTFNQVLRGLLENPGQNLKRRSAPRKEWWACTSP